jgi:hypothetical protein
MVLRYRKSHKPAAATWMEGADSERGKPIMARAERQKLQYCKTCQHRGCGLLASAQRYIIQSVLSGHSMHRLHVGSHSDALTIEAAPTGAVSKQHVFLVRQQPHTINHTTVQSSQAIPKKATLTPIPVVLAPIAGTSSQPHNCFYCCTKVCVCRAYKPS